MYEEYLNLEKNTCAARIFLNTFGLILEDAENIDEFSHIKIFDKATNEVGELHFDNGKVIMHAKYNNSVLDANFNIAKIFGFTDIEHGYALYRDWITEINFQLVRQNNTKLSGEFSIGCKADSAFGISCTCHPLIKCEIPEKGDITLKFLRDGSTFNLEIVSGDNSEIIDIRPWDWLNGFIRHDIKNGEYDEKRRGFPYRWYAGIFNGAECGENKDKLKIFLIEDEYKNTLTFLNEFVPKVEDEDSKEALVQKGTLMQQLDPSMFEKFKDLRNVLLIEDISLFDNLISVCCDSYCDEEIEALFGLKREKMNYQDGSDNLVNSYFRIGKNNCFLPPEAQKIFLKK